MLEKNEEQIEYTTQTITTWLDCKTKNSGKAQNEQSGRVNYENSWQRNCQEYKDD